jgi:hypothetical protein
MGKLYATFILTIQAFGADPNLLNLVTPDAKVVAGLQVDQAKLSSLGKYILGRMQPEHAAFKDLIQQASEIVFAANSDTDISKHWVIVARGSFPAQATAQPDLAILDNTTAIIGTPELVTAAVRRFQTHAAAPAALLDKVRLISPKYDFWFVTLVPFSALSAAMPEAVKENTILDGVTQIMGGAKFGDQIQFNADLTSKTERDAQDLANALRFFASLIQTGQGKSETAAQISSLLDNMTLSTNGNVTSLSLSIPERLVERLMSEQKKESKVP